MCAVQVYRQVDWLAVRGLVFDMDGTLYRADDELFYRAYAEQLAIRLKRCGPEAMLKEYDLWLLGESIFSGDYLYDFRHRWLVRWDGDEPVAGLDPRRNQPVSAEALASAYREGAPPSRLLGMGDGWTQLGCAAHCLGLTSRQIVDAYRAFQTEVTADPGAYGIVTNQFLVDTFALLVERGYDLVLMTMSQGEVVAAVLRALGVHGSFHAVLEGVRKPEGTPAALRQASEQCGLALAEWLVVGDNPVNDLGPARQLSLPTVLVHRRADRGDLDTDVQADTLAECLALLSEKLPPLAARARVLGALPPEH
ncbi:MAG: HAD family hydrolase [Chloroflexota bacterium]